MGLLSQLLLEFLPRPVLAVLAVVSAVLLLVIVADALR